MFWPLCRAVFRSQDGPAQGPKQVVSLIIKKTKYRPLYFDLLNFLPSFTYIHTRKGDDTTYNCILLISLQTDTAVVTKCAVLLQRNTSYKVT